MEVFDPVKYSVEENQFFLKHLGEAPIAALQSPLPTGVNRVVVEEVLGGVYELDELESHRGVKWAGKGVIEQAINRYLTARDQWDEFAKKGAPRFPTMHAWDGKGKPHRGGIGSDSGRVTTTIKANGERELLAVSLHDPLSSAFQAPWAKPQEPVPEACVEDAEKGVLQCPVDGWTTNFKPESRQSYNLARARMTKHCKASKDERVREFGLKAFG